MFTVQAVDVRPGGYYLVRVAPPAASGSTPLGNYALTAQFGTRAAQLSTFAADTVSPASPSKSYKLYVGQSQLMHLVLSADAVGSAPAAGSAVRLTIRDKSGIVIYTLTTPAGGVASGPDLFLVPGAYTVQVSAVGPPGGPIPTLAFHLLGAEISDPIGPVVRDPTLKPAYTAPGRPNWFLYPGNVSTQSRFLFVPAS